MHHRRYLVVNKESYLDSFHQSWERLLAAAQLGLVPMVPPCPGWNVASLVGHMGFVFTFWNKWVRDRPRQGDDAARAELMAERAEALPGFSAWRDAGFSAEATPPGVIDFAQRYQTELE